MNTRKMTVAALVLTLAACGGENNDNGTNNGTVNNGTTASNNGTTGTNNGSTNNGTTGTNNGTTASNNGTTGTNNDAGPMGFAIAATSDFGTSSSAWHVVDLSSQTASDHAFGTGDVVIARGTDHFFALDRTASRVQVLESADGFADQGVIDLGDAAANPHDAADIGSRAFVTLYNTGELAIGTNDNGTWSTTKLSLEAYDEDLNPEASAIEADEDFALIVLQRLTAFVGVENSHLLVLDTSDDSFAEPVDLGHTNVQAGLRPFGDSFAVGVTGDYGANDGGVLALTRNAAGDYAPGDMLVTEETLGGDLIDFVFISDTKGYAVITLPDFSSQLWSFDTDGNAARIDSVISPGFGGIDISRDGRWLVVGERDAASQGLVLFDLMDTTLGTQYVISTTLPPASISLL